MRRVLSTNSLGLSCGILYQPLDGPYIGYVFEDDPDNGLIDLIGITGNSSKVGAAEDDRSSGALIAILKHMINKDGSGQERRCLQPVLAPLGHIDGVIKAALVHGPAIVELLVYGDDVLLAEHTVEKVSCL